ncbi:chromatin structure-remodeling complex protein RSC7, partial [Tremellales sp. Uapishka_1]
MGPRPPAIIRPVLVNITSMSSTRSRRAVVPPLQTTPPSRSRGRASRSNPIVTVNVKDEPEAEEVPEPGPSRRTRPRGRNPVKNRVEVEEDLEEDSAASGRRIKRQVSYKEVPIDDILEDEDAEGEDDEDEAEEEEHEDVSPDVRRRAPVDRFIPSPASKRSKPLSTPASADDKDASYKKEPGTGGRGGFSVKGAAAAAARARWAKVRQEKAERGEESDEGGGGSSRRKTGGGRVRETRAALDTVTAGSKITVKGIEYEMGYDELIIPDDPKGDNKVDAEGRLLGGREYKLVTFNCPTREHPDKVYALTIDAARACGYTDSLAFLRRCPQLVKLACNAEERQMLIDIGRVTGNLKHRMVTMVTMRNVYKLMGARIIKNGKWVTDDYYEDESLAGCAENGNTPYATIQEDELAAYANDQQRPQQSNQMETSKFIYSLTPFYTIGGATTQFAGTGVDPWSDGGWGNRRAKLRGAGVGEQDWMAKTAFEVRRIDRELRDEREERIGVLEGVDGTRGWVWAEERLAEDKAMDLGLRPPPPPRGRSTLSQEVVFEAERVEERDVVMDGTEPAETGLIVVQTVEEENQMRNSWTTGKAWQAGVVRAAYEPHTQMPHVPQTTQPTSASISRPSRNALLPPGISPKGLATLEYTFDAPSRSDDEATLMDFGVPNDDERDRRRRMVQDAEEWEHECRTRKRGHSSMEVY